MRKIIFGILMAASVMATSGLATGAASAADLGGWDVPSADSRPQQAQYGGYGYCERLKYRCINRGERGEYGEGNCRRYREECGQRSYCQRLRYHCYHRDELGEYGEGNCRRYHQECQGDD